MTQSNESSIEFAKHVSFANITPEYTVQVIEQVQKLIDNGMWFSDACEVVSILTDFNEKASGFDDVKQVSRFWDFISDNCCSKPGIEPLIDIPMW